MKTITLKKAKQLESDLQLIEMGLSETVTSNRFEYYSSVASTLAMTIDEEQGSSGLYERVVELQKKGRVDTRKGHYLKKIYLLLAPKVEFLKKRAEKENPPIKDELFYLYESKGFRNSSIERLEALKLQLELSTQKGFYLMQSNKAKVKAQEDILIIAAQIIQELSYETDLVKQVILKFQGINEFEATPYVTEKEEAVIAACYSLLFNSLLDLNYR